MSEEDLRGGAEARRSGLAAHHPGVGEDQLRYRPDPLEGHDRRDVGQGSAGRRGRTHEGRHAGRRVLHVPVGVFQAAGGRAFGPARFFRTPPPAGSDRAGSRSKPCCPSGSPPPPSLDTRSERPDGARLGGRESNRLYFAPRRRSSRITPGVPRHPSRAFPVRRAGRRTRPRRTTGAGRSGRFGHGMPARGRALRFRLSAGAEAIRTGRAKACFGGDAAVPVTVRRTKEWP